MIRFSEEGAQGILIVANAGNRRVEVEFAIRDGSDEPDAVDSVGPEEVPDRVDEIPYAVDLLRAEGAGRFIFRAVLPTAEFVELGRLIRREIFVFDRDLSAEIFERARLAGPILMLELPEFVDHREEFVGPPREVFGRVIVGSGDRFDALQDP